METLLCARPALGTADTQQGGHHPRPQGTLVEETTINKSQSQRRRTALQELEGKQRGPRDHVTTK